MDCLEFSPSVVLTAVVLQENVNEIKIKLNKTKAKKLHKNEDKIPSKPPPYLSLAGVLLGGDDLFDDLHLDVVGPERLNRVVRVRGLQVGRNRVSANS